MSREYKESTKYCEETCPDVEAEFEETEQEIIETFKDYLSQYMSSLLKQVKAVGTEKLRNALCMAIRDKNDLESELIDAQSRIKELEQLIEDMRE